jgi:Tol biopolymer transport system component
MVRNRWVIYSFAALLLLSFGTGCRRNNIKTTALQAGSAGYRSEFDEPSARGVLQRISPEGKDVHLRYALSPDGSSIVYSASPKRLTILKDVEYGYSKIGDSALDLWKIPTNGGAPIKITSGGNVDCVFPSYTPDGNYIVYSSGGSIWKIKADGSGARSKFASSGLGYDHSPHVSSKNRIVFVVSQNILNGKINKNVQTLWTANMDGGELTQLREGSDPRWSNSGDKIAFSYGGDIWITNADGTGLTQITQTPDITESLPVFSKDDTQVAFVSNESADKKTGDYNIWTMNIDGTNKQQLTQLQSWESWPLFSDTGIYFLSGRAAADPAQGIQRLWHMKLGAASK